MSNDHKPIRRFAYNPHLLDDEELEKGFIARHPTFDALIHDIKTTPRESSPPHHLIIGQRGMGKSTLLRRIGLELRREPLKTNFLPLNFPEEQHVEVDRLSKFWLNCLDAMADTLEAEGESESIKRIDRRVRDLQSAGGDEEQRAQSTLEVFKDEIAKVGRRPVLLIDNFHLLLARLGDHDSELRGFFIVPGAPIIVAAATTLPPDLRDPSKSFYDGFKPRVLHRLSLKELRLVITRLAQDGGNEKLLHRLPREMPKLAALRDLTGGNPRTAYLLYEIFSKGFTEDVFDALQGLIDGITPLYQSYLEQLSEQGQIIVGKLARHQSPMTAAQITEDAELKRSSVSPQLGRLEDIGFVEKVALFGTKKDGYQIAERFFNIWYIVRFASRRDRGRLQGLAKFLSDFYTPEELITGAKALLLRDNLTESQIELALSLREIVDDQNLAGELRHRAHLGILALTSGVRERIAEIIDPDEIEPKTYEFAELRNRLADIPEGCSISGDEFADLVLSSITYIPPDDSNQFRQTIAAKTPALSPSQISELEKICRDEQKQFAELYGREDLEALFRKFRGGYIQSWTDCEEIDSFLYERNSAKLITLITSFQLDCGALSADVAEKRYRKAAEIDPIYAEPLNNLGNLLTDHLTRYEDAEKAYRKAAKIDPESAIPWNNLGYLLATHLARYEDAEEAYRKAAEIDPKYAYSWNNLGNLLTTNLARYEDAEEAYRKAAEIDPKLAKPWFNLGLLLTTHLARYEDAEDAYRKAAEIDPKDAAPWNNLGNLLLDCLGRPDAAREAFDRSITLDPDSDSPRHNLAFLLRDFLGNREEATAVLATLHEPEYSKDTQRLHTALDSAYDENWGAATTALAEAMDAAGNVLPPNTRDDWYRAMAILLHLGFGPKLVAFMEERSWGATVEPLVEAVRAQAAAKRTREILRNVSAEVRPSAEKIYDEIERRRKFLPKKTARDDSPV